MTKRTLPRDDDGALSAFAWPGGYPIFYFDSGDSIMCVACARRSEADAHESDIFKPVGFDINWEDSDLYCDECGERIESAYAEKPVAQWV